MTMERGLSGRVALITGAGGGIGRAVAFRLASEGALLALADRRAGSSDAVAAELDEAGGTALAMTADVSISSQVEEMVRKAVDRFGTVDILVNNAGIFKAVAVGQITEAEWDEMMAVNLKSVFLCSRAIMGAMKERRWGRIINLASIAGKVGGIRAGAHYAASKAGVICLTKSLATALAPYGVTVNAVAPGIIDTAMAAGVYEDFIPNVPLGRIGSAEEVAAVVAFLASEEGSYLTGEIIDVNGGLLMD